MKHFVHWNPKVLGLNWADKFQDIWGIFGQKISTHFGTVSKGLINQPLYLQKNKPLYPNPNFYLGLGFEFEPQRNRVSIVRGINHVVYWDDDN